MDSYTPTRFRHRQSPSSERFLGAFTHVPSSEFRSTSNTNSNDVNEFSEDDVFFHPDFSVASQAELHRSPLSSSSSSPRYQSKTFPQTESFGILAALAEHDPSLKLKTFQKTSISSSVSTSASTSTSASNSSSSRLIPAIPKPPQERLPVLSSSAIFHKHHSAPVNVPLMAPVMRDQRNFDDIEDAGDEQEEEGGMLPPHEIVARSSVRSPLLACSVLEGVGRTLKGRDLRKVRNAVWRQTGFIDS